MAFEVPATLMSVLMFILYLIGTLLVIAALGKWVIIPLVGAL